MPTMNMNDFPQEVILLEERYPATLKEVTEYEKDYGEGPVSKLAWVFAVEADEDSVDDSVDYEADLTGIYEIAAHTSFATGPNSNFAKMNFPAWVGTEWNGNTDELIGRKAIVDVTSYETKGGQTRNVIEKVRVAGQRAKPRKKPVVDEEDFNDIPD